MRNSMREKRLSGIEWKEEKVNLVNEVVSDCKEVECEKFENLRIRYRERVMSEKETDWFTESEWMRMSVWDWLIERLSERDSLK